MANPLRFDGQYLDQATGFYKMGARYDVPAVGWWTQEDPVSGCARNPQSLNRSRLVDRLMKDPLVASVHGAVRERLQNILMENARAFLDPPLLGIRRDPAAIGRLPEIRAPTLVIVGDQDSSNAQEIANLLEMSIPGARKVVLPGAYHTVNMEQPEEFNRVVLDFLSQV